MDHEPDTIDTVCVAGGLALMVFGAGLLFARPSIRRLLGSGISALSENGGVTIPSGVAALLPDVERYLKIKSM